jgi:cytoskeletal protein CcmA (bactofilin family)
MKFSNGLQLLVLAVLVLLPLQSIIANTVVRSGDTVTLAENQSIQGSFYVIGGTVALSGAVTGDTTVIGGNVTIDGEVTKDLAVLAGTVNLQAPVKEDARIVSGQVTITDSVAGDLVVIAGKLTISSTAKITGDVLFYGGELVIEGEVTGKLLGGAESVRVDAAVMGGIDISARVLTLGERAKISGNVEYASENDLVRAPGASVEGEVVKNSPGAETVAQSNGRGVAIMFLVSLFATLSFYLVFRRMMESFSTAVRSGLLVKTIVGFVFVFMAPLLVIILLVSVLGSLVGVVALTMFLVLITVSFPLLAVTAGSLLAQLIDKKSRLSIPYLVLGAVVVHLCFLLPVFGVIVVFWLFLATVGTLVDQLYRIAR